MTPRSLFLSAALALAATLSWGCTDASSPDPDQAVDPVDPARDDTGPEGSDGLSVEEPGAPGLTTSSPQDCAQTPWQKSNRSCWEDPGCPSGKVTFQHYFRYNLCHSGFQQTLYKSEEVGCGCLGVSN